MLGLWTNVLRSPGLELCTHGRRIGEHHGFFVHQAATSEVDYPNVDARLVPLAALVEYDLKYRSI